MSDTAASDSGPSDTFCENAPTTCTNLDQSGTNLDQSDDKPVADFDTQQTVETNTDEEPVKETVREQTTFSDRSQANYSPNSDKLPAHDTTSSDQLKPGGAFDQVAACLYELSCGEGQIDLTNIDLSTTYMNFPKSAPAEQESCESSEAETNCNNETVEPVENCSLEEREEASGTSSDLITECIDKRKSGQPQEDEECPNLDEG